MKSGWRVALCARNRRPQEFVAAAGAATGLGVVAGALLGDRAEANASAPQETTVPRIERSAPSAASLRPTRRWVQQLQGTLNTDQAAVDDASLQLAYTSVVAPGC